jgi:hypothetical protein
MAFSIAGFYPDPRGAGHRMHTYESTDAQSVVEASGYFDDVEQPLRIDDLILCLNSTDKVKYLLAIVAITSGVVTTRRPSEIIPGVISGSGATVTLTAKDSGKTIFMDKADGIVFTLPAPQVGLKYKFIVTVAVTSNAYDIDTDAGTTFLVGVVQQVIAANAVSEGQPADGTAIVQLSMNGTTKGGLVGTVINIECISATVWLIDGLLVSSGTLVTPFA